MYFGDIEPFLLENEEISPAIRPKLLAFLRNPHTKPRLQIDMAAMVDWANLLLKLATS